VDVAATGPRSPVPPGMTRLPGPGQFSASPALARLLRDTPREQLGVRYPGTQVGTIGPAALPAPNSLVIVVGHPVAELSGQRYARTVTTISTTVPSACAGACALGVGINSGGMTLILSVVAAALLFPVLIFIGGATRLSAARREQRFAAMRLVGATPRQVSAISTVESSVAAVVGVAVGFALFFAFRPLLAGIPFTGDPFFTGDLSLGLSETLAVALGVPLAAALAARIALRRVNVSPLGVTRRVTPRPPRAWRLLPLLAGVAELGYLAYFSDIGDSHRHSSNEQALVYLGGVFLIMIGLVVAGPWLTLLGSRIMARRAGRAATLIAGRRLGDNPKASFRAVSGLVLAVFVGTCALGIITTIVAYSGGTAGDPRTSVGTVIDDFGGHPDVERSAPVPVGRLNAIPGVAGVVTVHTLNVMASSAPSANVVSCAELARVPVLGRCASGADTALIQPVFVGGLVDKTSMADRVWPAADLPATELAGRPVESVVVGTDGSRAAVEQVRTVLEATYRMPFPPMTVGELKARNNSDLKGYQQLANVVILTSLPIAGCSLAISVAGGLAERRRPFGLLRLAGTPLAVLRRVLTLEAAVPLIITALVSAGAGLLAAQLFLRAQLNETVQAPSPAYYGLVVAGLLASLGVIGSTLPLLRRMTGPEAARNE